MVKCLLASRLTRVGITQSNDDEVVLSVSFW